MDPYYQDDFATLYHGDCREVTVWLDADVLVTDPPYGIRHDSWTGRTQAAYRANRGRTYDAVSGDRTTEARDQVLKVWGMRPGFVFGTWRAARPERVHALLIWHKEGAYSGISAGPFFTNHEEIYALGAAWPKRGKPLRSVLTTTEHRSVHTAQVGHPTPKPLGLMETLIAASPDGVIADPFAGSGSTLLAAKALGRRAIGVEVEERYCEIAANRLTQDTLDFGESA